MEIYTEDSTIQCLNNPGLILVFPFTHHTDAKDSRPVQATAVPAGTKATKLQPAKTADKGKKQAAVKKADINTAAESAEDKNKQTKPQVTHELSVVRFLVFKKYCFYIYSIAVWITGVSVVESWFFEPLWWKGNWLEWSGCPGFWNNQGVYLAFKIGEFSIY